MSFSIEYVHVNKKHKNTQNVWGLTNAQYVITLLWDTLYVVCKIAYGSVLYKVNISDIFHVSWDTDQFNSIKTKPEGGPFSVWTTFFFDAFLIFKLYQNSLKRSASYHEILIKPVLCCIIECLFDTGFPEKGSPSYLCIRDRYVDSLHWMSIHSRNISHEISCIKMPICMCDTFSSDRSSPNCRLIHISII